MTTLKYVDVDTAIAGLAIDGLRIKKLAEVPEIINPRDCPVMFADSDFLTDIGAPVTSVAKTSQNFRVVTSTLNYLVFYAPVNSGRGSFEYLQGMVSMIGSIANAVLTLDVAGVDIEDIRLSGFGTIKDTNNQSYFGFRISIIVSELVNND